MANDVGAVISDSDLLAERKGERKDPPNSWLRKPAILSPFLSFGVTVLTGWTALGGNREWAYWVAVGFGIFLTVTTIMANVYSNQLLEYQEYVARIRRASDKRGAEAERKLVHSITDALAVWANGAMPVLTDGVSDDNASRIRQSLTTYANAVVSALNPDAQVRTCLYILDYRDEEDGRRDDENAVLSADGIALGRSSAYSRRAFTTETTPGENTIAKIRAGKTIICGDITESSQFKERGRSYSYKSFISVPLEAEGEIRGMITCDAVDANVFGTRDESLLRLPAQMLGWVIANQSVKPGDVNEVGVQVRQALDTEGLGERGEGND